MESSTIRPRTTKYCRAIESYVITAGHATNAEIIQVLRHNFPDMSATTVHRATTRLVERGVLVAAPKSLDGAMRFDANRSPHDHFMCSQCGMLRDTTIGQTVKPIIERSLGADCKITGELTISGICKSCSRTNRQKRIPT
jgi:Fur family transcriptional regulator, peroxide stress response regulator